MSSSGKGHGHRSHKPSAHHDPGFAVTQSFEGLTWGTSSSSSCHRSDANYPPSTYSTGELGPAYPSVFDDPPLLEPPDMGYHDMFSHTGGYSPGPAHSYTYPNTEASLSSSMPRPPCQMLLSSILPSSPYGEFREAGREVARQRRRHHAHTRRGHKTRRRRAAMLSGEGETPGLSQAEYSSGSIDTLTVHHPARYSGHGTSYPSTSRSPYTESTSTYEPPYNVAYSSSSGGYPAISSTHGGHGYGGDSRSTAEPVVLEQPRKPQCWDHGCNGRTFSTFSNLLRHQREKSGQGTKAICHRCGAEFTRKTARDGHLAHDKCKSRSNQP